MVGWGERGEGRSLGVGEQDVAAAQLTVPPAVASGSGSSSSGSKRQPRSYQHASRPCLTSLPRPLLLAHSDSYSLPMPPPLPLQV